MSQCCAKSGVGYLALPACHGRWKKTAVSLVVAVAFVTQAAAIRSVDAKPNDRPNIIFILADDLGYGDVQTLNPKSTIPTPSLDRLAKEGMTFTDAHSGSAVCTPTRYGVVTGRYCWRSRLKRGVLNGYGTPLIETERATVASFLGSQGYTCGVVGKWHLGLRFARAQDSKTLDFSKPVTAGPNELGFDESYVIPASLDFPPYVYIKNGRVTQLPTIEQRAQSFPAYLRRGPRSPDFVMEDCLDHLAEQSADFIRRQARTRDKPFFLYFPMTAPHKPVLPHPRFRGKSKLGPYGDFVMQVDATVGQVLTAVDEAGIADNTLVMVSSDNGSFMHRLDDGTEPDHVSNAALQAFQSKHHTANGAFRGTKADVWEAGHHVPFFARWPQRIKAGAECGETICLTDLFATTADIIDAAIPQGAAPDSYSLLPLMNGKNWQRPPVINHSAGGMFAIRDGKWKLVLGNGSGGRQNPKGKPFAKPYQLYDLSKDIAEAHDCLADHPEVAARLEAECEKIRSREARE